MALPGLAYFGAKAWGHLCEFGGYALARAEGRDYEEAKDLGVGAREIGEVGAGGVLSIVDPIGGVALGLEKANKIRKLANESRED